MRQVRRVEHREKSDLPEPGVGGRKGQSKTLRAGKEQQREMSELAMTQRKVE